MMLLFLLSTTLALADVPTATPPSAAISYDLKGLRPSSASVHNTSQYRKRHLRFKNDLGSHVFVFEETKDAPDLFFLQTMNNWSSVCSVEVECSAKAFCTEECRTMYYPIVNTGPEIPLAPGKCRIRALSCSPEPLATPTYSPPQDFSK